MESSRESVYAQSLRLRNDLILMTVLSGPSFSSWLIPFLALNDIFGKGSTFL